MNGAVVALGSLTILIGLLVMIYGSRSRGEINIDLGKFKGPIWFLLIVLGLSTSLLGFALP